MMKLTLTSAERRLRDILVAAANTWPHPSTPNGASTTPPEALEPLIVRFAGGWVRDKLLSTNSADIDIALNIATGAQFASHVASYLTTTGAAGTLKFNTISRNAEQSKHLETATAHFLDLDLDFVNLRSEAYTDSSRIPATMAFGTAKEDAERRDLTINSLFYNLHTESVEDWTGMGREDMRNGIIRTPLEPMTTFLDDPLRVLRAVRFAARLNFEMTGQVKHAIMDERVKERLRKNVTVPRKADEVKKLLKGPNQLRALNLINECALYNHVFTLTPRDSSTDTTVFSKKTKPFIIEGSGNPPHPPSESVVAGNLVTSLLLHPIAQRLHLAALHGSVPWLLAGLAPWRGALHPNPPKREPRYIASLITKHELSYGDDVRGIVEDVFERGKMDRVKTVIHQNQQLSKLDAVLLIRELGPHWRVVTFTLLLYELIPHSPADTEKVLAPYIQFLDRIYTLDVQDAYDGKRLIPVAPMSQTVYAYFQGNELANMFGGLKDRAIAEAQEKAVVYQLVEGITTREEMEKAIVSGDFKFP